MLVSLPQDVLARTLDFTPRDATVVYPRFRPDAAALHQTTAILKDARRPVLLVESGVTRCDALDEVVRFAEVIGAEVYQGWMSDVNFPNTHPLYLGDLDPTAPPAKARLQDADVLVGIGCAMFDQGFYNAEPTLPKGIQIVQINEDPVEIGKNFPVDCGMQGDIKAVLAELSDLLVQAMSNDQRQKAEKRAAAIGRQKAELDADLRRKIDAERNSDPIAISRLMDTLRTVVTPDTLIVDDCWSSSAVLRQVLPPDPQEHFLQGPSRWQHRLGSAGGSGRQTGPTGEAGAGRFRRRERGLVHAKLMDRRPL